ncbi:MAG TPA: hypothetical protein PK580_00180 [Nitrosomonas halophila]|nr:hypothetical protein [Nitrosomonas halophila]
MTIRLGRVVGIHPEDNSVDVVMTDDGARLVGVQVLSPSASTRSGLVDLPSPTQPKDGDAKWDITKATDNEVIAAIAYFDSMRMPVVIGFLFPQINQMLFSEQGRRINRHESDVHSTVTKEGNYQWTHPNGTYIRIAEDPAYEDLTGKDFDKKWRATRNTDKVVHVYLAIKNAGTKVASVHIDPEGNITLAHAGNLDIKTDGTATHTAQAMTINAGMLTINSDVAINGDNMAHNGVNIGRTHRHSGVESGPDETGAPV